MKKFLKYAPICAALLALVAFVLLLATPGIVNSDSKTIFSGVEVLFGGKREIYVLGFKIYEGSFKGTWSGLLAFIFVILAFLELAAEAILPLLKGKKTCKYVKYSNLCAALLLVVGGVFAFVSNSTFIAVNEFENLAKSYEFTLGAGWIIAGILMILAGLVAVLPTLLGLLSKKKK